MSDATKDNPLNRVETTRLPRPLAEVASEWMIAEYGKLRNGAKLLAEKASAPGHFVSYRTVEAWLSGRTKPRAQSIEIVTARCEALAACIEQERRVLRELIDQSL